MRAGVTIFNQNYQDWDRFEAEERGEKVPKNAARPDRDILLEELNLARIADETGMDSVWTVEHHFTPYTMTTNPLQYLTYLAGITKKVDLGTMVTVIPWHNPVRVAEDINMLDTFLGPNRKVMCAVGRGLGRREYGGFGIDQNEARERFDESLTVLNNILATGECNHEGQHFKLKGARLRPQPGKDLSDSLYCAGGSNETVEIIARSGVKPITIPTQNFGVALESMKHYAEVRRKSGFAPVHTKLAVWTYVADSMSEAEGPASHYMSEYADSALRHYELLGTHFDKLKGYEHYAKTSATVRADASTFRQQYYLAHPWGTPDKVIARVSELAHQFGADEVMFIFKYGSMPMNLAEKSLRLFAKEVLPALREIKTTPIGVENAA